MIKSDRTFHILGWIISGFILAASFTAYAFTTFMTKEEKNELVSLIHEVKNDVEYIRGRLDKISDKR